MNYPNKGTAQELELAIAAFREALQVYALDLYSYQFAQTQEALGVAYSNRILGDHADNIERAIACHEAALQIQSRYSFPFEQALTQINLGTCFHKRILGEYAENLERAIAYHEEALQVITQDVFPKEWAIVQNNLGTIYIKRIRGDSKSNLERAITYFEVTLQVFTCDAFPSEWARAQLNLAEAYRNTAQAENLERALACCEASLQVFTCDAFPSEWVEAQTNLALVYSDRIFGERTVNQERAIASYKAALTMCTQDTPPFDWAQIQLNLGAAYTERILGDKVGNLEQALSCYNATLRIYTEEAFPIQWAEIQHNLGRIYAKLAREEQGENLAQAASCFQGALKILTITAFPGKHRMTALQYAGIEARRGNWAVAHDAYASAFEAEEILFRLGKDVLRRDEIATEGRDASTRAGFALTRLGQNKAATVAIERGRARVLAEANSLNAADPQNISNMDRRSRYITARKRLIEAQVISHKLQQHVFSESEQRDLELAQNDAFLKAQVNFDAIIEEIRKAHDPEGFLETMVTSTTIQRAVNQCGSNHALVYLVSTPWSGIALAAISSNPEVEEGVDFLTLDLPRLSEDLIDDLIANELPSETKPIVIGGFGHAQVGNGLALVLHNQKGGTFRDRAESLHTIMMATGQTSTLDTVAQTVLAIPALAYVVDRPLDSLAAADLAALETTVGHLFLQAELQRCMEVLAEVALRPLVAWVQEQGVTSMTLIPCGSLAAFPLAAVSLIDGRTLGETLTTSIAPSARSLFYDKYPAGQRSGVYAIGDPHPTHQELRWGEAEAHTLAKLARNLGLIAEARVQDMATRDWLVEALHKGLVVDASCHGAYNIAEPLQSALFLAHGERLTLADMLNHEADLRGLRLLLLSACQTAILDLRGARDEVRSLAAGTLQAGARAVLASLWSVDDRATYLLIVRFAQEWLPQMENEPPAAALARAQRWLRTVTNHQLKTWLATTIPVPTVQERRAAGSDAPERDPRAEEERALALAGKERVAAVRGRGNRFAIDEAEGIVHGAAGRGQPDSCPYADPIYWAGFQITGW